MFNLIQRYVLEIMHVYVVMHYTIIFFCLNNRKKHRIYHEYSGLERVITE